MSSSRTEDVMTEGEWLEGTDPQKMLHFLRGRATDRQFWLFMAACNRRCFPALNRITNEEGRERARQVVQLLERGAEGIGTPEEMQRLYPPDTDYRDLAWAHSLASVWNTAEDVAAGAVFGRRFSNRTREGRDAAMRAAFEAARQAEQAVQCDLLRCLVPNPFRPPPLIDPRWLLWHDATIPKLALSTYEQRQLPSGHLDPALLAVLEDALEEAGCTDAEVLDHLRSPGPHVRGCWPVGLLLSKE